VGASHGRSSSRRGPVGSHPAKRLHGTRSVCGGRRGGGTPGALR